MSTSVPTAPPLVRTLGRSTARAAFDVCLGLIFGTLFTLIPSVVWYCPMMLFALVLGGIAAANSGRKRVQRAAPPALAVIALVCWAVPDADQYALEHRLSSNPISIEHLEAELAGPHMPVMPIDDPYRKRLVWLPSLQPTFAQVRAALERDGFSLRLLTCGEDISLLYRRPYVIAAEIRPLDLETDPLAEIGQAH